MGGYGEMDAHEVSRLFRAGVAYDARGHVDDAGGARAVPSRRRSRDDQAYFDMYSPWATR